MKKLYLDFKQIHQLTGLSRTTIWRMEKAKTFPMHQQISAKRVGWSLVAVRDWARDRGLLTGHDFEQLCLPQL